MVYIYKENLTRTHKLNNEQDHKIRHAFNSIGDLKGEIDILNQTLHEHDGEHKSQ